MLPLVALPFFCLFFYVYKSSFGKETVPRQRDGLLQESIVDVSDEVKKKNIEDKLDAYRNQYKDGDGYTAVGIIGDETQKAQAVPDLYNQREKNMLDSIEREMKAKYGNRPMPSTGRNSGFPNASPAPVHKTDYSADRELAAALTKLRQPAPVIGGALAQKTDQPDPMKIFREQMALVDSMGKANDPDYRAEQAKIKAMERAEIEAKGKKQLIVSKSETTTSSFNTVRNENQSDPISAIVDQDITGYAGSRLRIRLLDDISAGRFLVKRGTYLYANITGFSGQRVKLTISSIFQNNLILPVKLEVYDNDGQPGLYVPASAFREFSKELGNETTQGITLQQQAENNSQLVMSMIQKMFQSTTAAVGKLIRSNKAKLKYNTIVYLIDPEQLKTTQSKY